MFSKTKIPRNSGLCNRQPFSGQPPLFFILFEKWAIKKKRKKDERRGIKTERQNHNSRRIADWRNRPLIGAISRYQPPPLPINVHYARYTLTKVGMRSLFALLWTVEWVYPSFWLMECGEAGENICEAVNYHSHCSPFYSRSTDVCCSGRSTWRGRSIQSADPYRYCTLG